MRNRQKRELRRILSETAVFALMMGRSTILVQNIEAPKNRIHLILNLAKINHSLAEIERLEWFVYFTY